MIEINLLPEELRKKESVKIALPDIPIKKTLLVSAAVLAVIQFLLTLGALYVKIDMASLGQQNSVLTERNRDLIRQKADAVVMQNRVMEIQGLSSHKFYWATLLNAVSESMTKGVWLTGIRIAEEEVHAAPAAKNAKTKGSKAKPVKESDKPADKEADKKSDKKTDKKTSAKSGDKTVEKKAAPVIERVLIIEGSAIGAGQETAYIGKFLKELKNNPVFGELFSDIRPSNINQKRFGEYEVYGFTATCRFKKEKAA